VDVPKADKETLTHYTYVLGNPVGLIALVFGVRGRTMQSSSRRSEIDYRLQKSP
jgi:hypothetical protein